MTGGVAYVTSWNQLNVDSVVAREVPAEDRVELRALVEEHQRRTGSVLAGRMLADWARSLKEFRQLVPVAAISVPGPAPEHLPEKEPKTVNQA
jgi:glutamate synthase (NADPH/NADH) large chain